MVVGWFRPPYQASLKTNDLELYNIRNDAWGLIAIAMILVAVSGAIPIDSSSKSSGNPAKRSYAKYVVLATIFHHISTGIGAYKHYSLPTHYNTAMGVGVWGCSFFALLGIAALFFDMNGVEDIKRGKTA